VRLNIDYGRNITHNPRNWKYHGCFLYWTVEKCRADVSAWRKKNPEKVRAYSAKYNDAKRITKEMDEWNNTLYELGYADLI